MTEANGERRALLIGVGRYDRDDFPSLSTPKNDIRGLARVLRHPERCRFTDVQELQDPDSYQLTHRFEAFFANAGPGDLVLLYFSGHGILSPRGGLHLCATNTNRNLLLATSLPLNTLNRIVNSSPIAQVVVILDCSFSGAAESSLQSDLPSLVISDLGQGQGKYVMTSSSAVQVSRAMPGDDYSLFTKELIYGLETGAADSNEDGVITVEEWYRYAQARVLREEPGQHPQLFCFNVGKDEIVIAQATASFPRRSEVSRTDALSPDREPIKEPVHAPKIFICYRREDSSGWAGRLSDRLRQRFDPEQIFIDVASLEPGVEFVEAISDAVGSCAVLLAVIGRSWLSVVDPQGRRRVDTPHDFIRLEIAAALKRKVRVIPILVGGAIMPSEQELPKELRGLAKRHALELSDRRWDSDADNLIAALERILEKQTQLGPRRL